MVRELGMNQAEILLRVEWTVIPDPGNAGVGMRISYAKRLLTESEGVFS